MDKLSLRFLHISGGIAALTPVFIGIFYFIGFLDIAIYYQEIHAPGVPVDYNKIVIIGSLPGAVFMLILGIIAMFYGFLKGKDNKKRKERSWYYFPDKLVLNMEDLLRTSQYPKALLTGSVVVAIFFSLYALVEYSIHDGKTRAKEFLEQTCTESLLYLHDRSTMSGCIVAISDDAYWIKPTQDGKPEKEVTFIMPKSTVKFIGRGEQTEKRQVSPAPLQSPN